MTLHFENLDTDMISFYTQARQGFRKCLRLEENAYLRDELEIDLGDIQVVDRYVNIKIWKAASESYIIEVCLDLSDGAHEIGRYIYIMDECGIGIDDSLVFF